ncbi:MAG: 2-nitropropane dioxygenase [Thermoanaerobaculia bacterium]
MANNFEITCPCCEATIVIDRVNGEVLLHKPKDTKQSTSLEAMVSNLETQKSEAAKRFDKNLESQKDRSRILEEKFKEAMKRADKSDKPLINPMDLD